MMRPPLPKTELDAMVRRFECNDFIPSDPVSVPHAFDDPRDQEVIGLYAALLSWGRRTTILNKMAELCRRMNYRPYQFVRDFDAERDGLELSGFVHRTFQPEDAIWLTLALSTALRKFGTVEKIFASRQAPNAPSVEHAIQGFSETMMMQIPGTPHRLQKHLARPQAGSACKRLSMYLRWMVRPGPVDLGIWRLIKPHQLVMPLDVHSGTNARAWGYLSRTSNDWKAVLEITEACRSLSPDDPVRYDFAFFGAGIGKANGEW